jgi:hypothetical protein
MEIGDPIRTYTIEPIEDPVPETPEAPVEEPVERPETPEHVPA